MSKKLHQLALNEKLVQACLDLDTNNIAILLHKGADPDFLTTRDQYENYPFHEAYTKAPIDILVKHFHPDPLKFKIAMELLLNHGANIEGGRSGDRFSTPLHMVVDSHDYELTKLLIARGANVNVHDNELGYTPLHIACAGYGGLAPKKLVAFLIEHGADINAQSHSGKTPANILAEVESYRYFAPEIPSILEILVKNGANLSIIDDEKQSALSLMQNRPDLKMAVLNGILKSTPNVNKELIDQITQLLPQHGLKTIQELNNFVNKKIGLSILDKIIDDHLTSIYPENLLEHKLIQATIEFDLKKMTSLLDEGADPNFISSRTWDQNKNLSALHFIVGGLHPGKETIIPEILKLLLSYGANPNLANEQGDTPLHFLAKFTQDFNNFDFQLATFNTLLQQGGDMNLKNLEGHTPADFLVPPSKISFSMLKSYNLEENVVDIHQEKDQLDLILTGNNTENLKTLNSILSNNTKNEIILELGDIIQHDSQDTLFNKPSTDNQTTTVPIETNTCTVYVSYVPIYIMQWLGLEKTCDASEIIL